MFFGCHLFRIFLGTVIILGNIYCMEKKKVRIHPQTPPDLPSVRPPTRRVQGTSRPQYRNQVVPEDPVRTLVAALDRAERSLSPLPAPRDIDRAPSSADVSRTAMCHCIIS